MSEAALLPLAQRVIYKERAQVVSTADPRDLLRVQVRVDGLMAGLPDKDLPWAEIEYPPGQRANEGDHSPFKRGDWVWVEWEDVRFPRIVSSCHFCPGGVPNAPHEGFDGPGALQHKRAEGEPVPAKPAKGASKVFTQHGITVEFEEGGTYRITDRATGAAFEISQGKIVVHTEGAAYRSSTGDTREQVGGKLVFKVAGDVLFDVGGKFDIKSASFDWNPS